MKTNFKNKNICIHGWNLSRPFSTATLILAAGLGLATANAQAAPIVIQDTYIGGTPTNANWNGKDVIGKADLFDISRMEVSFLSANTLLVDIYSRYLNNIGAYGTQLGDLFLSTNGYQGDGEVWEYALKLDTYLPNSGTFSGTLSLYNVLEANIVPSTALPGYIYRAGQEVQYNPAGQTALATGTWSLNNIGGAIDTDDFLRFTVTYDFGNVSTYGLHWGMTCGNDVIEGAAPVPEPPAMLLFGMGLIGLRGVLRRTLRNNNDIMLK